LRWKYRRPGRLVFARGHQQSVPIGETLLVADEDLQITFAADVLRPSLLLELRMRTYRLSTVEGR
jgi:hypothetical protein